MFPDKAHQDDSGHVQERQRAVAPAAVGRRWGGEHGKRDLDPAYGEHPPSRRANIDFEAARKPRDARRDHNGDDRQQPHICQQMNSRVPPSRTRIWPCAVEFAPHWSALPHIRFDVRGRVALGALAAEVVLVHERLRQHLGPVGPSKVLHMQRVSVGAKHLIAPQVGRIADDVDTVEFRLYDGVVYGRADAMRIAEHKGYAIAAIVYAVCPHERIGRSSHHHAICRQTLYFVVLDDCAASVLGHYPHRCASIDVVAADHRPGAYHLNVGLVGIYEVVMLYQHGNVAGDDRYALLRQLVVADADDIVVRIGRTPHGPESGVLVVGKLIIGHRRIAPGCPKTHTDAILEKAVALQQRVT